jgi:hypothetical protein
MIDWTAVKNLPPGNIETFFAIKLNETIAEGLRALMETKGLYQSVSIDWAGSRKFILDHVTPLLQKDAEGRLDSSFTPSQNWALSDTVVQKAGRTGGREPMLTLQPINFKLFCGMCKRDEAFKPVWFQDITNAMSLPANGQMAPRLVTPEGFQLFSLIYQCQSCLGTPEGFLLRRDGLKIGIHGRSPMESVSVPTFIPSPESKWYREAVIAMKVSRTLAAIFYLRTFIEQFARRVTKISDRRSGDEILSEYNGTIPDPPRGSMPSLKEWYEKLSELIHSANEDTEILKKAFEAVDRHFEFRKLYRMPEKPAEKIDKDEKELAGTEAQ